MCNCIEEVDAQLLASGRNTKLDIPITFSLTGRLDSQKKVTISTCKRDDAKREKALRVFASYCPFCGIAYEEEKQSADDISGEVSGVMAGSGSAVEEVKG